MVSQVRLLPWRCVLAAAAVATGAPLPQLSLVQLRGEVRRAPAAGPRLALSAEALRLVRGTETADAEAGRMRARVPINASLLGFKASTMNCMTGRGSPKPGAVEIKHFLSGPGVDEWKDLVKKPLPSPALGPKLMVAMMIYRSISFPKAWRSFIEGAPTGSVSMLIHAMENVTLPEYFQPFLLKEHVPASRCNAVILMTQMMTEALRDPFVTHFAVVSGDTLPLRQMSVIKSDLIADGRTRFCADQEWQRAETWLVLRRDHFSLFAEHAILFKEFMAKQTMSCADEEAFFVALSSRNEDILDRCQMMTDWMGTDKNWRKVAEACECPHFLASEKVMEASCARPSTRSFVTRVGLEELLASPGKHWFVRKFTGDGPDLSKVHLVDGGIVEPLDDVMSGALGALEW